MKTIREVIQFGGSLESIVRELEAREKERDEAEHEQIKAEQERVKSALKEWVSQACKGYVTIGSVLDAAYPLPKPEKAATILVKLPAGAYWVKGVDGLNPRLPIFISELNVEPNKLGDYVMVPPNPFHSLPPKPETLPAGYWWEREGGEGSWSCSEYYEDFVPCDNYEYRYWNDPPPEVTGKAAPLPDASRVSEFVVHTTTGIMRIAACSQDHAERIAKHEGHTLLPTFEEWCKANVEGWKEEWRSWFYTPGAITRHLPLDVFDALKETAFTSPTCKQYVSSEAAIDALRAALIEQGRIRP